MASLTVANAVNGDSSRIAQRQTDKPTLDVYARPFIPLKVKAINELPATIVHCQNVHWINFSTYVASFTSTAYLEPLGVAKASEGHTQTAQPLAKLEAGVYASYFDHLLDEEAAALLKLCEDHALYKAPMLSGAQKGDFRPSMYLLPVPGLRESSLRVEIGDVVHLRQLRLDNRGSVVTAPSLTDPQGRPLPIDQPLEQQYNAIVWGVDRTRELLSLRVDHLLPKSMVFNVKFTLQSRRLQVLRVAAHHAHRGLSNSTRNWIRSMLFPKVEDGRWQDKLNPANFNFKLYDPHLNFEQLKAIDACLGGDYGDIPFLISGPPGTGKTKTIVEIAMQMVLKYHSARLLMCAPSDPAADTLIYRLSRHLSPKQLFRLNSPARSFAEVPNTVLPYCHIDEDMFSIPSFGQLMNFRIVVTTCRDAEILSCARVSNMDLYSIEKGIYDNIHPEGPEKLPLLHWTSLLIDEAAQATEPEAVLALNIVAPPPELQRHQQPLPTLVMAGDQNQLGPRTASRTKQLQASLFERLLARSIYQDHPLARSKQSKGVVRPLTVEMLPIIRPAFANLIRNYRSHLAIIAMPSALFYNDTLTPEADNTDMLAQWSGWRGRRWPVMFSCNTSPDEIEQDGGGWFNVGEARKACKYALSLVEEGLLAKEEICIMSPFSAQVKVLRQMARQSSFDLRDVNIGPVEAFQGLESRFVILCTTRSRERFLNQDLDLGFGIIHEARRFNVALTRARQGLVVLGHPALLARDKNWLQFMQFCRRNQLVDGPFDQHAVGHATPETTLVSRLERQLIFKDSLDCGKEGPLAAQERPT